MSVTDEAIGKIRTMIIAGELLPGDRLPPEQELSDSLGLSRNSLREAVKALELVRVLEVRRGDGTYVTSLEPRLLLDAVSFVIDLHNDRSILDVFAVRRILEPAAAAMATPLLTDDRLVELRQSVARADATRDVEALVDHDLDFHHAIVAAVGNDYLTSLIDGLASSTVRARIWRGLTQTDAFRRTLDEHASIVGAMEARDTELVRSLMTSHIAGIEAWLRQAS
ncbi:FadR/GntR family transcriptional regulator [Leifsonia sp. McL0607]|uniref:FadR/GntR family transcriptional regulator n=1 Tax=Leifsonia sp. McL0607 TaxID=3415672 RepID=UPI003CE71F76